MGYVGFRDISPVLLGYILGPILGLCWVLGHLAPLYLVRVGKYWEYISFRDMSPTMENQMKKTMDDEREAAMM